MKVSKKILIALGIGVGVFALFQFSNPTPEKKEAKNVNTANVNTATEVNSEKVSTKPKDTLANLLEGKYLYNNTENSGLGEVFCFTKDEIVVIYTYEASVHSVKSISSDTDNATFELESSELGSPENIIPSTLKVTKIKDSSVSLEWSSGETPMRISKEMKILSAEECVSSIVKAHPDFPYDQNWDDLGLTKEMFNKALDRIQSAGNSTKNIDSNNNNNNDTSKSTSSNDSTSENHLTSDKISESEAISICDQKVRAIGWHDDSYGSSFSQGITREKYYHIMYDNGESFAVNMYTGEVHHVTPAGDGLSSAL